MSAIIGQPGGSLVDAPWAASGSIAHAGLEGEKRTAVVLARVASVVGPTVLHDLAIPADGVHANIDHAVVSGSNVWLIDSKAWHPGFLWSFGSTAFRGLTPFPPATKRTMPMARDAVTGHLCRSGLHGTSVQCLAVIWPSRPGTVSTWALRLPGTATISGHGLSRRGPALFGDERADPRIVDLLVRLVQRT